MKLDLGGVVKISAKQMSLGDPAVDVAPPVIRMGSNYSQATKSKSSTRKTQPRSRSRWTSGNRSPSQSASTSRKQLEDGVRSDTQRPPQEQLEDGVRGDPRRPPQEAARRWSLRRPTKAASGAARRWSSRRPTKAASGSSSKVEFEATHEGRLRKQLEDGV